MAVALTYEERQRLRLAVSEALLARVNQHGGKRHLERVELALDHRLASGWYLRPMKSSQVDRLESKP